MLERSDQLDVTAIKHIFVEQMDLEPYGIMVVWISPYVHMWSVDGRPELCLTADEALASIGLCATWKDWSVQGGLVIEPWEEG